MTLHASRVEIICGTTAVGRLGSCPFQLSVDARVCFGGCVLKFRSCGRGETDMVMADCFRNLETIHTSEKSPYCGSAWLRSDDATRRKSAGDVDVEARLGYRF